MPARQSGRISTNGFRNRRSLPPTRSTPGPNMSSPPLQRALGGRACFPSQKPYPPFQQWAMRAEGLKPSPLGILIHPVYGLWHAYRGAIAFDHEILIQEAQEQSHPCDLCIGKPCLSACPVNAFSGEGYDVAACRSHLATEAGGECMGGGCLARLACPVGRDYVYGRGADAVSHAGVRKIVFRPTKGMPHCNRLKGHGCGERAFDPG